MTIQRILVANRGEIACRIMRTARSLGYETVAVYSDADAGAAHVRAADDAVRIGPAPVAESYLDVDRIIGAARSSDADALHPGYGFLSENPLLAEACEEAGITFVGPPPVAIRGMADKGAARRLMADAGVPCVPGYDEPSASDEMLLAAAEDVGLPLMIKAAAGGGGRGMRLVTEATAVAEALVSARSEAEAAFGSGELILERAVQRPRHVEVQVFADAHGTVIHLGERDCSIQRRHQKVIEEAPSPAVSAELRATMGEAAVAAARAIDYRGAGTVEFLLDPDGNFYFLEMNTRLQVEHPVTEAVTGLDLVALQFRVAEGLPLGLGQDDVRLDGWAIEARLYAEDPEQDFLPATGRLIAWEPPTGIGVRVDAGVQPGDEITPFYDPLLAKIIASGPTREVARRRLRRALGETACLGVTTNRDFLVEAVGDPVYAGGEATTAFIAEAWPDGVRLAAPTLWQIGAAVVLDLLDRRDRCAGIALGVPVTLLGWGSPGGVATEGQYRVDERTITVSVAFEGPDRCRVKVGEETLPVQVLARSIDRAELSLNGTPRACRFALDEAGVTLSDERRTIRLERVTREDEAGAGSDETRVVAPMHGVLVALDVDVGDHVLAGQRVAVLEAMKMQHELRAAVAGRITVVSATAGAQVAEGASIIDIEPEGDDA